MPLGVDRYILDIGNGAVGLANLAQVHFDVDVANLKTDAERLSAMIAYMSGPGENAINTSVVAARMIPSGALGSVPLPFPVAEYAAWVAANAFLIPMAAYGVAYGAGQMGPAGTSATVSIYTAVPGRAGTGRHYRPYTSEPSTDAAGGLDGLYSAGIDEAAAACFQGTGGTTWAATPLLSVLLSVYSATAGVNVAMVYKTSRQLARLRSRIR
jgi:hypothetical protein